MGDGLIHLPLVVTRGGIEQLVGVLSVARDGDAEPGEDERTTLAAVAALIAVADRSGPGRLDGHRALRVVRADGPHRPADRPRQRADVRPDPRARAGPRRPAGRRGLAGRLRRRRPTRDERGGGPLDRRRHPARGRGGPRRVGPARRHGRPGRWRRVRARRARRRRDGRRPARPRRDRGPAGGLRPPDLGLGRGRPVPGRRWNRRRPARRGRGRAGHGEDRRTRRARRAPGASRPKARSTRTSSRSTASAGSAWSGRRSARGSIR